MPCFCRVFRDFFESMPCFLHFFAVIFYCPYISAANGDISTAFDLLIDFDLLKAVTSTGMKPEVVFSGSGRHLDKLI